MLKVFLVLVMLITSFIGGIFYQKQDTGEQTALIQTLDELTAELSQERIKTQNLSDTLQLVKRQIQADRIAYQNLLEAVEASESERQALRDKVEAQQELLRKLRDRLDGADG